MNATQINPIIRLDYPDPDVIRVEDTYYMVSTTMHFMPGCEILRSYDLLNWEHVTYVYDVLDSTQKQTLEGEENAYGQGMWAASLRFHNQKFYICFAANDTRKTYLYTASNVEGPWNKSCIEGFYHDSSLLFDEDKVYIVYGNKEIHLTELQPDLKGPLEGGLNRVIVNDVDHPGLGYEGAHFYKINGMYYVFFIHSLRDQWRRVEACFWSKSLEGEFVGGDILNDDRGYCNQGVAQGGIVDTPDGDWYAVLFQDYGAVGRIPVLLPVTFQDQLPIFGEAGVIPPVFPIRSNKPGHKYAPLIASDDFKREKRGHFGFKSPWQFNHEPNLSLVHRCKEKGELGIETGKVCRYLTQAQNILTQRMIYPGCQGEVTVNAKDLKEGDYVGISAFQGCYAMVALTKRRGQNYLVMINKESEKTKEDASRNPEETGEKEWEAIMTSLEEVRLKVEVDFTDMKDEAQFYYFTGSNWRKIGVTHKLYFQLDHFTGCRFGLVMYSTIQAGGTGYFSNFIYRQRREQSNEWITV